MTVLCASCSTWMLPLLLLLHLLICFHPSCSAPTLSSFYEFSIEVDRFGEIVKNCPENCSLSHNINQSCRCFNVSVLQEECSFPNYFIHGLKSLQPSIFDSTDLINTMDYLGRFEKNVSFCSSSVKPKALMSPKCLHKKLKLLKEQINSDHGIFTKHSIPTEDCELVQ